VGSFLLPLAVAAAFALACVPALRRFAATRARTAVAAAAIWIVAAAGLAYASVRVYPPLPAERDNTDRPVQDLRGGYVSSAACRSCHPQQYATWHASYHRTMTQVATAETAVGDFDDVKLTFHGLRYQLQKRGNELWVAMDDPAWDGPPELVPWIERKIVLSTGSHHDQDYWYATPGPGRELRLLPLNFRVHEKKWVPFSAAFLLPPHAEFDYSPSKWTQTCIKCHATYGEQRVDEVSEQVDARVAEFGIACEACHGPAYEHVGANHDPRHRYGLHFGDGTDDTITNPAKLDAVRSSQVCGQCHGQWSEREAGTDLTDSPDRYRPGGVLEKQRIYQEFAAADPSRAAADPQKHELMKYLLENDPDYILRSFWPDGQIRISGREYTGMIASPCFRGGKFSCVSCHSMHPAEDDPRPLSEWADDQLAPQMGGNQACLQCHPKFESAEALTAHTHHAPESSGSTCYNCHMPWTVYGIMKAHRSHQIDSPSVAATVATGRPNACNACHLDKTLAWAADHLAQDFGAPRPALGADESSVSAAVLWALRGDAGQRILTAAYMGWEPAIAASHSDWMMPYLSVLMADPYDAVRFVAGRSLHRHPGYADVAFDYVGSDAQIRGAKVDVERRWLDAKRPARGPAVLQRADGSLDAEPYARLLGERNQRRVQLDE
jgi:Cytochrome c554 and c-prime